MSLSNYQPMPPIHALSLLLLVGLAVPLLSHAEEPLFSESESIATVDGIALSITDFNSRVQVRATGIPIRRNARATEMMRVIKLGVASEMIDEFLIEQEAKRKNIVLEESDLQKHLDDCCGGQDRPRHSVRTRLMKERLIQYELDDPVTLENAKKFYDEYIDAFSTGEFLYVREILLRETAPGQTRKVELEQIKTQLGKGSLFEKLATKYSENSAANAGRLIPPLSKRTASPTVWQAIENLKRNEVSQPVNSAKGWHLFQLVHRKQSAPRPFHDVQESIRRSLDSQRRSTAVARLQHRLRTDAQIENHLANRLATSRTPKVTNQVFPMRIPVGKDRELGQGLPTLEERRED